MNAIADDSVVTGGGRPLLAIGFMVLLAGIDIGGTMLAKEWTIHRQPWQLAGGVVCFVALFAALVIGLRFAEMSMVTLGWIVMLQTAVILIDRSRYGVNLSVGGWIAIGAILVLQGYLLLGGTTDRPAGANTDVVAVATNTANA